MFCGYQLFYTFIIFVWHINTRRYNLCLFALILYTTQNIKKTKLINIKVHFIGIESL